MEIEEEVAPLVREAFRLAGLKKQSLRKILATLAGRGLVSRHGRPLSADALADVLRNPFYAGAVSCNGETARGSHEPLVSPATSRSAMANLRGRRRH